MSEFNKGYYRREGRKVGIFEERVRIIKLLEADRHESHAIDDIFDGVVGMTLSRSEFKQALIKLINGETK